MAKPIKKKTPSRDRYEKAHPVVSCRVSRELYDRLREVRGRERVSFTEVLELGLGMARSRAKQEAQIREKGRSEGYKQGYGQAEGLYKVAYQCSKCGGKIDVTSDAEKKDIAKYMQKQGWCHSECHQRRP